VPVSACRIRRPDRPGSALRPRPRLGRRLLPKLGPALAATVLGLGTVASAQTAVQIPVRSFRELVKEPVRIAGGFGSGLALDPRTGDWLLLTDRGPNYEVGPDAKVFPVPDFAPMVGRFRLVGSGTSRRLDLIGRIRLRRQNGVPLSGLPRPAGPGATGERAVSASGGPLTADEAGIDPEGIHALGDGTFWVAEEYGPSLIHFGVDGREQSRVDPIGGGLPGVLANRRPNRGFEGLTGDLGGNRLIAILQSPLDNPTAAGRTSRWTRIVVYHPHAKTTEQFLYPLDHPDHFVGDLTLLPDGSLLVIENDGSPPSPRSHRRILRARLEGATDIGRQPEPPVETLDSAGLAKRRVIPVAKTLVVDLATLGYRHDKPEGIVALSPTEIAIINDDDFGIAAGPSGQAVPKKVLGNTGPVDQNRLWLIRLPEPLWPKPAR